MTNPLSRKNLENLRAKHLADVEGELRQREERIAKLKRQREDKNSKLAATLESETDQ